MNKINLNDSLIPEGHEIDVENSDLEKGIIAIKPVDDWCERWEDFGCVAGFYVEANSRVYARGNYIASDADKNVFATKQQAEASIAVAQLSQLLKRVNGDWMPDWNQYSCVKFVIFFSEGIPVTGNHKLLGSFLAFKDKATRDRFLKSHYDLIMKARPILGGQ